MPRTTKRDDGYGLGENSSPLGALEVVQFSSGTFRQLSAK